jgi:hypothetical protein
VSVTQCNPSQVFRKVRGIAACEISVKPANGALGTAAANDFSQAAFAALCAKANELEHDVAERS